jgi:hypothetical protein
MTDDEARYFDNCYPLLHSEPSGVWFDAEIERKHAGNKLELCSKD